MKKSLIALGVLSAFAGAAHAQSSVTLYGLIDEGLDYTNNVGGHSLYALSSGDAQGSRWGMKGAEDLGGGLSAIFRLESGLNVNNGKFAQEGQEFGRQAYVGVASTTIGTLTLGRQYDSLVDYLAPLTANGNWGGAMFSHPYDNDNTDNSFRINNAVKYTSVDYAGFTFGGAYAFSNSTNFAVNRAQSVGAQYINGPLNVAAAYLNVDSPNNGSAGAVANLGSSGTDGSWTAARQRVFGVGINYTIASATLTFVYTHTQLSQPTATEYANLTPSPTLGAASSLKFNNFEVNAKYQFTPSFFVGGMYTYTQASYDGTAGNSAKPKYHQFGLIADYNLSKRTDVYVQGSYVKVASASDVAGTGLEFAANPDAAGPSSSSKQVMARVGIRQRF
ncbi:porin [Paraburkholderia phytofirmans OLGA172]|uniref:Porin n=1 Tax=Paraburkholderia phytofirmans OLGA172 TaxID=1417228 RepID=A0A160FSM4_9BURK|nr:porin [Paraburkholderia phytofirmans]ANB75854.1 porin [Paraburkholderia phytofirmans OLGA172]